MPLAGTGGSTSSVDLHLEANPQRQDLRRSLARVQDFSFPRTVNPSLNSEERRALAHQFFRCGNRIRGEPFRLLFIRGPVGFSAVLAEICGGKEHLQGRGSHVPFQGSQVMPPSHFYLRTPRCFQGFRWVCRAMEVPFQRNQIERADFVERPAENIRRGSEMKAL